MFTMYSVTPPATQDSRSKLAGCLNSLLCLQEAGSGMGVSAEVAGGRCHQLALSCLLPLPLPPGRSGGLQQDKKINPWP